MKKLYTLIIGAYIGPFLATFFIVLFILVMQFLWLYVDDLVGKGLNTFIILELLFYASAHLVPMALPLAILLSSIMTLGNLGEHYELVALKASGLSLLKIIKPLFVVVLFTAFGAFYFANNIWPIANLKFNTLLYDIRHKKPAIDIQPGVFYKGIEGYVIRVSDKDNETNKLYDVLIYDHSQRQGANKVIRAESGSMNMSEDEMYLILTLHNGYSYNEVKDKEFKNADKPLIRSNFNENIIRFNLSGFQLERTKEDLFKNNHQMLSISQINETVDTLKMEFTERLDKFYKQRGEKLSYIKDSVNMDTVTIATTDNRTFTVTEDFTKDELHRIVEMASSLARAEKNYANSLSRELEVRTDHLLRFDIEWHRKFSLGFTCIVLFLIGAPLGAIIRKGGFGLPVVIAVMGFLVFYMLNIIGEKLIKEGTLTAFGGMWLSSICLLPIALYLTYKASTDSALFEGSTYLDALRKLAEKLTKRKQA